ncbi:MAG TPA: hypothetical protein DEH25_08560, partial [Chloroflexi bacterium]|nr:hypothetical protein [Chloroflexota bacterium]
ALPDLTPDVEACFYRIAQEALENTIRHANAQQVEMHLLQRENQLELWIKDDGLGFDPLDVDAEQKLGLRGMHERALGVGGVLEISSQPEVGTVIRLSVEVSP